MAARPECIFNTGDKANLDFLEDNGVDYLEQMWERQRKER